jgi:hypothetical protein
VDYSADKYLFLKFQNVVVYNENVAKFRYLGTNITNQNLIQEEI